MMAWRLSSVGVSSVLFSLLVGAHAASDSLPHFHTGKFSPYELGPPSVLLSSADEEKLASGEPVTQAFVNEDGGSRRLLMVKDIHAPADVIMGRILDFDRYSKMVKGCDSCVPYSLQEVAGLRIIKCSYKIRAATMRFHYFMEHTYDPEQNCLVWRLDYSRRSDLDDSVGYWYCSGFDRGVGRKGVATGSQRTSPTHALDSRCGGCLVLGLGQQSDLRAAGISAGTSSPRELRSAARTTHATQSCARGSPRRSTPS